jgi:hypothetical protein
MTEGRWKVFETDESNLMSGSGHGAGHQVDQSNQWAVADSVVQRRSYPVGDPGDGPHPEEDPDADSDHDDDGKLGRGHKWSLPASGLGVKRRWMSGRTASQNLVAGV